MQDTNFYISVPAVLNPYYLFSAMVELMTLKAVEEIELNIKEAQKIVDTGNSLERLLNNRDFKKVVLEGYFSEEAVRLVHLKADPSMQTPEKQESIIKQMDAIGSINSYFTTIKHKAMLASKAITADEETREELLQEGLE